MKQHDPTGLKRLHRDWRHRTTGRVGLILESVQQPYNVGAVLRSAAAFRVDHLWLAGATAAPSAPGARKTALGTERYLKWSVVDSGVDAVAAARADGLTVIGLELTAEAVPLHDVPHGASVCVAVGNEVNGLSRACLEACDVVAYLPLLGRVGSLNVATAASIALYELRRKEWETQ